MRGLFIGRYELLELLEPGVQDDAVAFWRAQDTVLDREVSLRLLDADDPRAGAYLRAAQAAAGVEDRRLVHVLDIFRTEHEQREYVAVVSEWVNGRTVDQLIAEFGPLDAEAALALVDDVAQAIAAGLSARVQHGRLRPSSVLVTDAGEVRVRGMATDAVLFGPLERTMRKSEADVDGCGSLLYLLTTGTWPGPELDGIASAPRAGRYALDPSSVRADVPISIDEVCARSVQSVKRPRGMANAPDISGLAALITSARSNTPPPDLGDERRTGPRWTPIIAILVAFAIVLVVGWVGITMIGFGSSAKTSTDASANAAVLTDQSRPSVAPSASSQDLAIVAARSFDPYGDDNHDGKPDKRKGRENQDTAATAIDGNASTGWRTDRYSTANLDGKPGVGLILDLGTQQSIRSLSLTFDGTGTDAQVRVSNEIQADPSLWTQMASVQAAGEQLQIRSPRPITGRYVLVWLTRLPSSGSGYRGGIKEIGVRS